MTDQKWRWAKVVLSVPGAVGFFLPFVYGYSPLRYTRENSDDFGGLATGFAFSLAFAAFGWHLRHAIFGRLSRIEMVTCAALGISGSVLMAVAIGLAVGEQGWSDGTVYIAANAFMVLWLLCGTHLIVLFKYRQRVFTDSAAAVACLMAGYLPTAAAYLLVFLGAWQIGAYVVLLACLCYIGTIVVTVRRLSLQAAHTEKE